jgi:hypothetical protein
MENPTAQNLVFKLQGQGNGASNAVVRNIETPTSFSINRFPTQQEQAFRPDQVAWKVDANISGANPDLGGSAVTSYAGIENGSLTLTQNAGSIGAQIPCSSTNSPSGTTCASGNESVGVSFVAPTAGDVLACASFSHRFTGDTAGESVSTTFQIVETPTNSQTISQEGKSRIQSEMYVISSNSFVQTNPLRVCGNFTFASAGQKVLRLMYEQSVSGTINTSAIFADAGASNGQRDIHWEVYPLSQAIPAPLLVGSVTSNSAGLERVERAQFSAVGGPTVVCSSSPCTIQTQSGSWLSSVTRGSAGVYTANITAGIFSGTPVCVCNSGTSVDNGAQCSAQFASTSAVNVYVRNSTGTLSDGFPSLICMGPR